MPNGDKPESVGFPPWSEAAPGMSKVDGSPVHSLDVEEIRVPGQPLRSVVVVPAAETIWEAYDSMLTKWEDAPGLQDKRLGTGYLCFHNEDTGEVLRWQIPAGVLDSPDAFYDWLEENGFDEDEEGFFLYCDNSPDFADT